MLERITRWVANTLAYASGLFLAAVFLIILINSTQRYLLSSSFEWGEELPVYLAVYGLMFGLAWAYLQDRHIRFNIVTGRLPKKWAHIVNLISDLMTVFLGGMLAYSGWLFMMKRGKVDASSLISSARALRDVIGIEELSVLGQMYPYYFAVCVGGGLLALAALLKFFNRLQHRSTLHIGLD